MFSKLVETAVKRGHAAKAGVAANSIAPATDGTVPSVLVHAQGEADVDTLIAAGRMEDVLINEDDRLYPVRVAADVADLTLLMPTADGALIPATSGNFFCAQAIIGAKSGNIAQCVPVTGKFP